MFSSSHYPRMLRLGAILSLTTLGCARPSSVSRPEPQGVNLHEITRHEIEAEAARFATVYDMVRTLRPTMLTRGLIRTAQSRSTTWASSAETRVYLDGLRYGGVESLRTISAVDVVEVRWMSAVDATIHYGTGNPVGAIAVTSRSGRR